MTYPWGYNLGVMPGMAGAPGAVSPAFPAMGNAGSGQVTNPVRPWMNTGVGAAFPKGTGPQINPVRPWMLAGMGAAQPNAFASPQAMFGGQSRRKRRPGAAAMGGIGGGFSGGI